MQEKTRISPLPHIKILLGLLFTAAFFILLSLPNSAQAQGNETPTPNPTIIALENQIATQEAQIEELRDQITDEKGDREYFDRDIQWQFGIAGTISTAIIALLAFLGISNIKDIRTKIGEMTDSWFEKIEIEWEKRSQVLLDEAIYKIDIGNLPIYLPINEGMESIFRLLKQRRFSNTDFYESLDEFSEGIFILSLKNKNKKQQKELLDKFTSFIDENNPNSKEIGYIIFAPKGIIVPKEVMDCYENLVTANYPATVLSMVFVIARGLEITPPKKK